MCQDGHTYKNSACHFPVFPWHPFLKLCVQDGESLCNIKIYCHHQHHKVLNEMFTNIHLAQDQNEQQMFPGTFQEFLPEISLVFRTSQSVSYSGEGGELDLPIISPTRSISICIKLGWGISWKQWICLPLSSWTKLAKTQQKHNPHPTNHNSTTVLKNALIHPSWHKVEVWLISDLQRGEKINFFRES